jgi:hypothetical protein
VKDGRICEEELVSDLSLNLSRILISIFSFVSVLNFVVGVISL